MWYGIEGHVFSSLGVTPAEAENFRVALCGVALLPDGGAGGVGPRPRHGLLRAGRPLLAETVRRPKAKQRRGLVLRAFLPPCKTTTV